MCLKLYHMEIEKAIKNNSNQEKQPSDHFYLFYCKEFYLMTP